MNDSSQNTVTPQQVSSAPAANPQAVDDIVAMGQDIQQVFAQNDQQQPVVQPIQTPAATSAPTQPPTSDDQKSPLDILEEILNRQEKSQPQDQPAEPTGPTEQEVQVFQQQQIEQQQAIEAQRQKLQYESSSDEQKQRDQIRQQQMDALKVNNPYEIKQLTRKKVGG